MATVRYNTSGMILYIHSDASYIFVVNACSRASGVYLFSNPKPTNMTFQGFTPVLNEFVLVFCKILRNIMVSTTEAEYGALFLNGQTPAPVQTTLIKMNHS